MRQAWLIGFCPGRPAATQGQLLDIYVDGRQSNRWYQRKPAPGHYRDRGGDKRDMHGQGQREGKKCPAHAT
jgi:hypothetical protein